MTGKAERKLRSEVDELRTVIAVHGTVISCLIGALGPEFRSVMRRIIDDLPSQEAFAALSARERRIFQRELEKLRTAVQPITDSH